MDFEQETWAVSGREKNRAFLIVNSPILIDGNNKLISANHVKPAPRGRLDSPWICAKSLNLQS